MQELGETGLDSALIRAPLSPIHRLCDGLPVLCATAMRTWLWRRADGQTVLNKNWPACVWRNLGFPETNSG